MQKRGDKDKFVQNNIEERRRNSNTGGKGSSEEGMVGQPLYVQSINEQHIYNINYNNFDQKK